MGLSLIELKLVQSSKSHQNIVQRILTISVCPYIQHEYTSAGQELKG
jgi:hypothetical protein